jgi:carboxyl-terminal processing protease
MIKPGSSGSVLRRCRGLVCALFLIAFLSCSPSPASAAPQELSPQTRAQVFDRVWKEIHEHYYDPAFNGVNWDDVRATYLPQVKAAQSDREFYELLNEMTGELHDAHTRFSSPEQWSNSRKQQHVSTGFSVDDIDGNAVITAVTPSSSAAAQGIEPGMTILSVDGKPVAERLAEINARRLASSSDRATRMMIYSRLLAGSPGSTVKLGLRRLDDSTFEASIVRHVISTVPDVATDVLPLGYAYIRFDGFQPHITSQFRRALTRFRNSPGIVIDLRRNGGGDLSVLLSIAGYFFDNKTLFAQDSTRSGKPLTQFAGLLRLPLKLYVARSGHPIYSGPVVVLVGPRSASSSEVFAAGMQDTQRARIVGSATCGCVLGIAKPRTMKGGGVLEISEVAWFSPKGRRLEGTGITPDEEILPTASDFRMKRDPALLQAEQVLRQMGGERRIARQYK